MVLGQMVFIKMSLIRLNVILSSVILLNIMELISVLFFKYGVRSNGIDQNDTYQNECHSVK
jgi:hypothetical protein